MQYISTANQQATHNAYKITEIIVAAFCVTPILLIIIGKMIVQPALDGDLAGRERLAKMVYASAIGIGLVAVILRRIGLSTLQRGASRLPVAQVLGKLRGLSLLVAVLGELVGIVGFVAALALGDDEVGWRLGVVSLLLILYSFPRRWEWERVVANKAQD